MDSFLSLMMGQVSVVVVFKTSWLFSVNLMAVILSSQPAGCSSVSTLALATTSTPVSFLSQVFEYSDSTLLTSCALSLPFCHSLWPYCCLLQPSRITSRRFINHSDNHRIPAGEMSMNVVGERQRTKAFIRIYKGTILY